VIEAQRKSKNPGIGHLGIFFVLFWAFVTLYARGYMRYKGKISRNAYSPGRIALQKLNARIFA